MEKVCFKKDVDVMDVVRDLQALPKSIRPILFSEAGGKIVAGNVVSDSRRSGKFAKKNPSGFFTYSDGNSFFVISTRGVGHVEVTLYLAEESESGLVKGFFEILSNRKPVFRFACEYQEPVPDDTGSYVVRNGDAQGEYYHRRRSYLGMAVA